MYSCAKDNLGFMLDNFFCLPTTFGNYYYNVTGCLAGFRRFHPHCLLLSLLSARELTRLVGLRMVPVMQHFSETISGASTIRGFAQQSRFQDKCWELIYGFSRPMFHIYGAQEWLIIWLELLSSVMFACSLIFLISIPTGTIDTGIAGLAVTYGLSLNAFQVFVIGRPCLLSKTK